MGYLLVAFIAGGRTSAEAVLFYFAAYFATTLAAFGLITLASRDITELDTIDDYRGLFWRRPWLAGAFSIAFFSLAGIPLTAGFIAKYSVVASGVHASLWTLVIVLAVNSAIGLYYYLRVIVAMYSEGDARNAIPSRIPAVGSVVLSVLTLILIVLGVYPAPVMDLIHRLVAVSFL